ncbi:glycoside hydrolase family 2 protein [Gorillibacterium sp. sgz5001074]|uniref:glycoside hydrolase family 2 protein n=1 Tax=Gorillibacterium sp. sgz5001074 TaxID=3446695 RepID=UPI003F667787
MRTNYCLNGEWDFMPLYGGAAGFELPPEPVYEERKVQVPSSWRASYRRPTGRSFGVIPEHDYAPCDLFGYPQEWAQADAGVLHRTIRLPNSMAGGKNRLFLRFDGIMQKAAVYLDGERIGCWEDGYLPLLVDVTDQVQPDTDHDLHVVCGSFDKVTLPSGQQKITGLAGSWFGALARGIWQDVTLESRPAFSLSDMSIRTSVRERRLEVQAEVSPPASSDLTSCKAALFVRECDGRQPVLQAEAQAAEWLRQQDGTYRVRFMLDWPDAKLWSPDQPFLYRLELVLSDGNEIGDRLEERFGFREIRTEGPRFLLNGIPLNLRGDSWHFQGAIQQTEDYVRSWYRMCKEVGINCIRLHAEPHPSYYLDIADEEGMLIVDETAIYGSGKSMLADHPDFLDNCRAHVRRLVQRDKNHPSVILWSLQNEMRWVDGRDGFKLHIPSMMDSIRELDPTRPILVEGDNRLLAKEHTEIESRHYNIDGTIAQWDRVVPLVFGEHGGWWYVCPQNSSMYVGLSAYRHTDQCVKGLAVKEKLFVEYARRQEVSGIATFNFAHYFMRAMPDRDIPLSPGALDTPGPKPRVIPRYSLTLNNGLLPDEYPSYKKNPSFDIMAAAFKPVTIIPAEYNRSFFDDEPIVRSFDVYNDTLHTRSVQLQYEVRQGDHILHREQLEWVQNPAERKSVTMEWRPEPVSDTAELRFLAVLLHDGALVHELSLDYRLVSASRKNTPVEVGRPVAYIGGDADFRIIRTFAPACMRLTPDGIEGLTPDHLLVAGSRLEDPDGRLEKQLQRYVALGGRVLLLEQHHLSLGNLAISRQDFIRAHSSCYDHPVLQGLSDDDLMYWHEDIQEDGPLPIIHAAFEKPVQGDFTMLLECSSGDFGDGGDLWSPLLEYHNGNGLFIANQLELMQHADRVPEACLLLRNLLTYLGAADIASVRTGVFVGAGSGTVPFLRSLGLKFDLLPDLRSLRPESYGLLVVDPGLLADPVSASAIQAYAQSGGKVVILPAVPGQESGLIALLNRPAMIREHETYHLEMVSEAPAIRGFSPVDLFGFDKVFLSPREVVNRPLAAYSLEIPGAAVWCASVEGTAWKDYYVGQYTDEYSRVALVELNRDKAQPAGSFMLQAEAGQGLIVLSQLLPDPDSDKSIRLYTRLLANLGAVFDDGLLSKSKGDAQWAVEKIMALPCRPYMDAEAMKAYYIDPEFSLNNLGEGLYGWMLKKERSPTDGSFVIREPMKDRWFLSCFVHLHEPDDGTSNLEGRIGQLHVSTNAAYEIYMNGTVVPNPEKRITLKPGLNRLIAILQGADEEIRFRMVFRNADGTYMRNLQYKLTIDEVEPK